MFDLNFQTTLGGPKGINPLTPPPPRTKNFSGRSLWKVFLNFIATPLDPLPLSNKAGWAFRVNCSGITIYNVTQSQCSQHDRARSIRMTDASSRRAIEIAALVYDLLVIICRILLTNSYSGIRQISIARVFPRASGQRVTYHLATAWLVVIRVWSIVGCYGC